MYSNLIIWIPKKKLIFDSHHFIFSFIIDTLFSFLFPLYILYYFFVLYYLLLFELFKYTEIHLFLHLLFSLLLDLLFFPFTVSISIIFLTILQLFFKVLLFILTSKSLPKFKSYLSLLLLLYLKNIYFLFYLYCQIF